MADDAESLASPTLEAAAFEGTGALEVTGGLEGTGGVAPLSTGLSEASEEGFAAGSTVVPEGKDTLTEENEAAYISHSSTLTSAGLPAAAEEGGAATEGADAAAAAAEADTVAAGVTAAPATTEADDRPSSSRAFLRPSNFSSKEEEGSAGMGSLGATSEHEAAVADAALQSQREEGSGAGLRAPAAAAAVVVKQVTQEEHDAAEAASGVKLSSGGAAAFQARKAEVEAESRAYIQAHPELQHIMHNFLAAVLAERPGDIPSFAVDYFSQLQLEEH